MRYISRFKNSIRASSVYSLAFMLTFALAAGLTTYEEAAAQSSITLSADHNPGITGNQTDLLEEFPNDYEVVVTATLDGPLDVDDIEVTVKVAPIDSSRYEATPEEMTFTITRDNPSGSTTIMINPEDDNIFHADLTISITGESTGRFVAGTSLTLLDDDQDVTLTVDDEEITEMGEEQEVQVTATVLNAPPTSMEVPIMVSGSSSRYSVAGDMTIEISGGDTSGKTTLKFTPVDNSRYDEPADITISIASSSDLEARSTKVTLTDDSEKKPALKLAVSPDMVKEDGGDTQVVRVTATLDGDAVQTATKVTLKLEPADADRYSVSGTKEITIPAGGKSGITNLSFVPVKDGIFNVDLPVTVTGSADGFEDATDMVTIRDDDQEVELSVDPTAVTEKDGEAQKVTITATLPTSRPKEFMVPLTVTGDTNRYSVDNASPVITIDAGESSGTAEIMITPNDDALHRGNTDVTVSVTTASNLAARSETITITDDEAKPTLQLAIAETSAATSLNEDGDTGTNSVTVMFQATLKGPSVPDQTQVSLSVSPENDDRYELQTADPTITISGGGVPDAQSTATVTFNVVNDGKFFQDLDLTVTASAEGFDDATTMIMVRDDDQDITLSLDVMDVTESKGEDQEVQVTATLPEAPPTSKEIPITVTSNSARYSVTGDMTIEIAGGDTSGKTTLKITPVDNDRFDETADIVVSVTSASGLNARTLKITVTDDDESKPTLKLAAVPTKVDEEGGDTQVVAITATLDGDAVQTATTVALKLDDDEDRFSVSGTKEITIPAGSKTGSTNLAFVPVKDGIFNPDLTITITGSADGFTDATVDVTLRDDDQEVILSVDPAEVTEKDDDAQKVTITATLPTTRPKDFMVPLTVAPVTGYQLASGDDMPTITIAAGESSGTAEIEITTTDNAIYNDDIKIMVSVTEASGLAIASS